MIKINLLHGEDKKKETGSKDSGNAGANKLRFELTKSTVIKIVSIAAGLVITLQIMLFLIGVLSRARETLLEKRYNKMLPEIQEAEALGDESEYIKKKIAAIDSLMIKPFRWSKKINELSDSMIAGIWLASLSNTEQLQGQLQEKQPAGKGRAGSEKAPLRYLVLDGYTAKSGEEGTALVGKFIQSLKSNQSFYSDFSTIDLVSIKSDKFDNQDVMNFKIACLFKD